MPLTKVTSSLINTISASQIVATGATAGQVLTYNGSTSTWVASATPTGNSYGQGSTLAWVNFDGMGTVGTNQTIRGGYNVSSVYKNATGDFTIFYTTALPTSAYCVNGTTGQLNGIRVGSIGVKDDTDTSTLSARIQTVQHNGSTTNLRNNCILITY